MSVRAAGNIQLKVQVYLNMIHKGKVSTKLYESYRGGFKNMATREKIK